MNFKGHVLGGSVTGIGVAVGATSLGYVAPDDLTTQAAVAGTTLFFSLFPDLDTASVAQRWFFRGVFCVLLYLGWTERYELATIVGLLSVLPLLDHHRGWTHWKISPFITVGLLGTSYEYWRARQAFFGEFTWDNVHALLEGHLVFFIACIVGWYTHLLLDGCFKIFPTSQDHH